MWNTRIRGNGEVNNMESEPFGVCIDRILEHELLTI